MLLSAIEVKLQLTQGVFVLRTQLIFCGSSRSCSLFLGSLYTNLLSGDALVYSCVLREEAHNTALFTGGFH